ncbi:MAG: bifunctional RNase H/acid phosphatase [Actinomycetales bacterium]
MSRRLIVEADGGSRGNPGPAAYGAVVRDGVTGAILVETAGFIGTASNNVAEYQGAIAGLEQARLIDAQAIVEVRLDSKLIVEQMSGRWQIKHPDMRDLAKQARAVLPPSQVSYLWVGREQNQRADALVNHALDEAAAGNTDLLLRRLEDPHAGLLPEADDVVGTAEEAHVQALVEQVTRPPNRMIGWTDLGPPTVTLLARHGATEFSLAKRFSGRGGLDVPLADLGLQQAQALADELALRDGIDAIVSSPLLRAQQTAAIAAARLGLRVSVDDDLAECDFGDWDGLTFSDVQQGWPEAMDEWLASVDVAPPNGESFAACRQRVDAARRRIVEQHQGERVLVVAHVTPIKLLVGLAVDAPLHSLYRMELSPCSLTTLAWFPDGNASMFSFSESAHLREVRAPDGV